MIRQSIVAELLMACIVCNVILEKDGKMEAKPEETGKTAYMYWNPTKNSEEDFMESRGFVWLEKESFEEYMGYTTIKE